MGYTQFSIDSINSILSNYPIKSVLDYGAQNIYDRIYLDPPYAREWYNRMGIEYTSIDLNGECGALKIDLSYPIKEKLGPFDLVVDCGTSEHCGIEDKFSVSAFYNAVKNKHDLLRVGGIMHNENPKTGNWPGHGFNYYTENFYIKLAYLMGYEIISIGEHPAMGNDNDGWVIYCTLIKKEDRKFISLKEFETLDFSTE